ncbi:hypothetical protein D7Y13_42525, partial [Corallococcus praedator]
RGCYRRCPSAAGQGAADDLEHGGLATGLGFVHDADEPLQHAYLKEHPGAILFDDTYGIDDTIEAPHFNNELAAKSGLPAAYDFGVQRSAWLAHMVTDWCGDDGFVTGLDIRLRRPNYLGDTLWLDGTVTEKRRDEIGDLIELVVRATNPHHELD